MPSLISSSVCRPSKLRLGGKERQMNSLLSVLGRLLTGSLRVSDGLESWSYTLGPENASSIHAHGRRAGSLPKPSRKGRRIAP